MLLCPITNCHLSGCFETDRWCVEVCCFVEDVGYAISMQPRTLQAASVTPRQGAKQADGKEVTGVRKCGRDDRPVARAPKRERAAVRADRERWLARGITKKNQSVHAAADVVGPRMRGGREIESEG